LTTLCSLSQSLENQFLKNFQVKEFRQRTVRS
jgi:hypothetical protein